jgi:hypothetical protein
MTAGDYKNGSNLTGSIIGQGQLGATSTNILAAIAAGTYVKISKAVLCNTSAAAVTVTCGAVKSGGTLADATATMKTGPLGAAGEGTHTVDITEWAGLMLGPGDFLAGLASTGSVVTFTVSGAVSS